MGEQTGRIRRVVLLGHTGFIGSRLAALFSEQLPDLRLEGLSLPSVDLSDSGSCAGLEQLMGPGTAVVMTAAVKKQVGDTLDAFEQNVAMVVNVCRVLERVPVERFVYFSSAAVYGEDVHNLAISEKTPACPRSYYGCAKYASERLLVRTMGDGASLLCVRPPTVYGPGDTTDTYGPPGFVRAALSDKVITLWGEGDELREFVYVDDVADAVFRLTFSDASGVVNLASGRSHSFRDVLDAVGALVGRPLRTDSRERSKAKVDNAFDNRLVRQLLPGFEFTSLEDGVRRTFEAEKASREEG